MKNLVTITEKEAFTVSEILGFIPRRFEAYGVNNMYVTCKGGNHVTFIDNYFFASSTSRKTFLKACKYLKSKGYDLRKTKRYTAKYGWLIFRATETI